MVILEKIGPKYYVHCGETGACLARWCRVSGEIFGYPMNSVAETLPGESPDDWLARCRGIWPELPVALPSKTGI